MKKGTRRSRKIVAKGATAAQHLLSDSEVRRIAERAFKLSEADETEVSVEVVADAVTRFANNAVHQNMAEQSHLISVRTVFDGRTARATTNKTDDDSLRRVVAASSDLARQQPKNPDLLPMPGPQKYAKVKRYVAATAVTTPEERAAAVKRVCARLAKRGQTGAGIFSTGAFQSAIANARGLFASHRQTRAEFSITVMDASGSSGWAKANEPDVTKISPVELAESASWRALGTREARELPPGRYIVVLDPAAVLDLVGFLFYDFAATAVADQRSCLNERIGKRIFGENISLADDVTHPLQTGAPFDGEGMPRRKVALIEKGVPSNLVYARASAKKAGVKPTGHGFTLPNEFGEAPMNLVWGGGAASIQDMIASTDFGLLVTRTWYIREVDPYEKIMTGMTRDGTFLIDKGRVAGGVRNFRFNQSLIEMLSNVEMLGPAVRAAGEESFEMVVPAMKVRDFHFTEVTKF
jgi:predicted Zn-dependent protease